MSPLRPLLAALVLVSAAAAPAAAARGKSVTAVRATSGIAVDGALDEAAWAAAEPIRDLEQKLPAYGARPRYPSEIRVVFDGDALYIGARMWNAPGATRQVMTRRDQTRDAERFIVSFDPYRTRRLAYSFAVTAAGVRADWIHTDDTEGDRDMSWDPVWSAATRLEADGWSAELRVPWSQLRYPDRAGAVWGVNFNRYDPDVNEDVFWIAVPRDRVAWSSYMGELHGLVGLPRRSGVELLPYISSSVRVAETDGDGDQLRPDGNVGLDAKVSLGAGLTLDVAVNPDFGQVEADPAIVNLTAYEVSLPERRPFFVAGNEIFASAPGHYFYSRRIGDEPDRLLGAAKLSGRVGGGTNVGALAAITEDKTASDDVTGWSVARVEREVDASRIGATVAAVGRAIDGAAARAQPSGAVVAGVDGTHRWDDGGWELGGSSGVSSIWGHRDAIAAIQTTSTHYFQRPDNTHVELDPTRTTLSGWHTNGHVARRAGAIQGQAELLVESPEFDTNPTGLLASADEITASGYGGWYDTTPSTSWLAWQVELEAASTWTFGNERRMTYGQASISGVTTSLLHGYVGAGLMAPSVSDTRTRGGPLVSLPAGAYVMANASSNNSSIATWGVNANAQYQPSGTSEVGAGGSISLRPDARVRFELAPRVKLARDRLAYVATMPGGPADTFGVRYVFGALEQRELVLVTRVELTLRPDLAIDLYLEPFVSTGTYTDLAELEAAGTRDLRRYDDVTRRGASVTVDDGGALFSLPEPDFTARSLRSTAVLRWEPRPGSTLYAVWQQDRGDSELRARALGSGLADSFTAPGAHTIAVKLAWWLAR
ncbi:MAG TPA: DUF5916 domain-containing protein [Kofleriaceae bacterium]|nr:DUF5916 domain-containing protein [Kofleriaceae bacterium]